MYYISKDISGLSPHNIYITIYYRKAVKRNRYVIFFVAWPRQYGAFRFTDPYGIASLPSAFVSPFVSANQSLEGPYHGSPVVGLLDSAGHYSRNGIIPTSLPSFYITGSRPAELDCIKLLCLAGVQKKDSLRCLVWA